MRVATTAAKTIGKIVVPTLLKPMIDSPQRERDVPSRESAAKPNTYGFSITRCVGYMKRILKKMIGKRDNSNPLASGQSRILTRCLHA